MFNGIPSNWPIKNSSIFEHKYYDKEKNNDVYQLKTSELLENECHMFFPIPHCEELLIATTLEFITFHPQNKKMNDKFNIKPVQCGDIELFWCSFPKEFKDVCERAAKVFGMTMKIMPRIMVGGNLADKKTVLEFPGKENILCFEGKRYNDPNKVSKEWHNIVWLGNSFEKLGID